MFSWLNKQGVRSDRGFEFQYTGRFSAEYRADGRCITFEIEDVSSGGKFCTIFGRGAFDRWDSGHPIQDGDRAEIINNVREAIEFQGLKMEVE